MKFKKLEVLGFKSFADKLEVKFDTGITAIVGPNGCGKSNVADSIRWVLGEQSAKLLRGHSMQDVIFNGTENRKSLSFCEVSLHFDNREKLFPTLDYAEVVISRKLYRSGESEYALNRTQCRLKDITDLLRDGGMGREGYSIIGQGRIDELLSAKPEDRRAIFEEAAGISKFKARKIESERKLERTRENLVRICDILEEKSKMLEPLTRQSENARKWLEMRDKLKFQEINTYIHQYDSASHAKQAINERLNGAIEEIDLRQKECDRATSDYNEAMVRLSSVDKDIDGLREELLNLTVGIEKQAGELKLLNERLSYLNSQNERLKAENMKLDVDYRATLDFIDKGTLLWQEHCSELKIARENENELSEKYLSLVAELTEGEGEVESNHRAMLDAMDRLSDIKSNMSRLLAEKEGLEANVVTFSLRRDSLTQRLREDEQSYNAVKAELDACISAKNEQSAEIESAYAKNNECLSKIAELATELDSLSAKFYMAKSKHKMLGEMQQAYEGFAYSVKNLLADAKSKREVAQHIEGVVAQIVTVKQGFETAIEMALGNAVQNIVTKSEDDAKFLIGYLKQARYGRVTFLPMTSVKPRVLDAGYQRLLTQEGCYGVASDLIDYDKKYASVIAGLLGGTVVVDNMDTALRLARASGYGFKIVTLEGDIVNPQGSITGGSKKSELTNIFGYEREIAQLDTDLKQMQSRMDEINLRRDALAKEQGEISGKTKTMREEIHAKDVFIAGQKEVLNKLSAALSEFKAEFESNENGISAATERIRAIDADINSVGELENIITTKKRLAGENSQEKQLQFDTLRKERDFIHEKMTQCKMRCAGLENDVKNFEKELERLKANVVTMADKLENNNVQIADNDALIAQIDADMRAFSSSAGVNDSGKVSEIRNKLSNLDDYKQQMNSSLAVLDTKRMEYMSELQRLHERKNREEMLMLKVDTDIEQMQQRIKEEYDMEYADCVHFKEDEFDINKGIAEIARLKRQMSALGSVNLDAIEQCKQVYESYHEMDVQREDLVKAENDLLKIIKELSNEMIGRFSTEFEKIRVNFVKIFKELFDGGTADLILQESENPLEAGIEIVAQPPSKKLQSISLLSGGERALTAIAILFAILRLKPMPFCVLDEIEAALDDANAGRFAKYLRRFSEETQFIVITHRKPTMEMADNLYGVTMEEKGVSKIVSVKLSEAIASAQPES